VQDAAIDSEHELAAEKVVLSVTIMTHPARSARSLQLARQYPEWGLSVVTDPSPGQRPGALRTARVAWRTIAPGATHHLVIQDDVDFQPDFFGEVVAAAARHPGEALAFFAEWGSRTSSMIRIAALRGASWAEVIDGYIPTQALLLPAEAARGAAEYLARGPDNTADDGAIREYLLREGVPQLVSVPNLVEHLDLPSVSGNGSMGQRRATCYSHAPAATARGDDTAVTGLTRVPYYSWRFRRAEGCVRADARSARWLVTPITAMLADMLQVPVSSLESACDAGLSKVAPGFREAGLVTEDTMRQMWFTAFALGIAAADGKRPAARTMPSSQTARLALQSFVPGALRTVLGSIHLALATRMLTPVMYSAIRSGYTGRT
jgi:hypothetical protein